MKRLFTWVFVVAVVATGFLSIRGTLPFMPIMGISMEPKLHAGDMIFIEDISPEQVKVGDIIVYVVPPLVRDAYNYPVLVAHRVIKIEQTSRGTFFRTKGDNVDGEDPFTVRPRDIKGTVGKSIPYIGFPMLFFQSQHGLIFIIVALTLLAIFLFTEEIGRGRRSLQRGIFAPVIEENQRTGRVLEKRLEKAESQVGGTEQALVKFAEAIGEYATHLKSHTSAIQGLSEASHELKRSSAEQNRVLMSVVQTMGQSEARTGEAKPPTKKVKLQMPAISPDLEKALLEQGRLLSELKEKMSQEPAATTENASPTQETKAQIGARHPKPPQGAVKAIPGCFRCRKGGDDLTK